MLTLQVVHLVRDPRGMFRSLTSRPGTWTVTENLIKKVCNDMEVRSSVDLANFLCNIFQHLDILLGHTNSYSKIFQLDLNLAKELGSRYFRVRYFFILFHYCQIKTKFILIKQLFILGKTKMNIQSYNCTLSVKIMSTKKAMQKKYKNMDKKLS